VFDALLEAYPPISALPTIAVATQVIAVLLAGLSFLLRFSIDY
jgi:hypothetical protein